MKAYHSVPIIYIKKIPVSADKKRCFLAKKLPIIIGIAKSPIMNPPVGPAKTIAPDLKPAKTGRPSMPKRQYIIRDNMEHFLPKIRLIRITPKLCIVKGTAPGMHSQEHKIIITAPIDARVISCVEKLFFFIKPPYIVACIYKNHNI